jgi:hypothetical protein
VHFSIACLAIEENSLALAANLARGVACLGLNILSFDLPVFDSPKIVDEQAEAMCEMMWGAVCDRANHQSLLPWPLADVAVARLALLFIGCPPEPASVAPVLHLLAVLMNSDRALWALLNRVAHLREVTEAGRARRPQMIFGALIELWFLIENIFLKLSKALDSIELLVDMPVVLIVFDALVVIEEVNDLLFEGLLQIFDGQYSEVLIMQTAVLADWNMAVHEGILLGEGS